MVKNAFTVRRLRGEVTHVDAVSTIIAGVVPFPTMTCCGVLLRMRTEMLQKYPASNLISLSYAA